MISTLNLRLKPEEAYDPAKLRNAIASVLGGRINDYRIIKRGIDARQKQIWVNLKVEAATGEDNFLHGSPEDEIKFKEVKDSPLQVVIVGAGPSGLFAALRCLELGLKPIIVERGKPVEQRLHDIVTIQKEGKIIPESNFCFGEGGAGTYSDGKLYTRSKKRGDVQKVLELFHYFGADSKILYEAHPHIGSDRLAGIIKAMRNKILSCGGEIYFNTKFESLLIDGDKVRGILTSDGREYLGPVVLATGHSAHDVYHGLQKQNVRLEAKGFAMGVRLEHPQNLIDKIIYHDPEGRKGILPPAEYSLSCQVDGRGVYSFCMCPGGVIVPAASNVDESVVNGMSASGRSGKWANSGMVVEIRPEDFPELTEDNPLGLLAFQKATEQRFFKESNSINAPAQRMKDFVDNKKSKSLPKTSYVAGIHSADMRKLLPSHVSERLAEGFKYFGKKYKGFLTNEATLIGLESRTSSPVRIPRRKDTMNHVEFEGLYPVGEGAGYAGGIVSSAIDGMNAIDSIYENMKNKIL